MWGFGRHLPTRSLILDWENGSGSKDHLMPGEPSSVGGKNGAAYGNRPPSEKPTYQDLAGHGWGTWSLHLANHAHSYRGVCYVEHDLRLSGFET